MTIFIPGELYKTKTEVPVYLINGSDVNAGSMGLSYWSPGNNQLPKIKLKEGTYVMCLSIKEIKDRRKHKRNKPTDLIETVPCTPSSKKNTTLARTRKHPTLKESQPVFELCLLQNDTTYVFVCSGNDTLKSVAHLFFEPVILD